MTVQDSQGDPMADLQQNEFRVFEDGIEQPIALFSADAFLLSAAIPIGDDLKTGTAGKVRKTIETLAGAFPNRRAISTPSGIPARIPAARSRIAPLKSA